MSTQKRVLVLTGDGINCERETAEAFEKVGFHPEIRHINDLILEKTSLSPYSVLALPGGFSFGDDLSSGKVLALKIAHSLKWNLKEYAKQGGLVIGICNGFQALIRLGVFGEKVSITHNLQGQFLNRWVSLSPSPSKCVWTQGLPEMVLPIRHGEGRIVFEASSHQETLKEYQDQGKIALRYPYNPNGSEDGIAGLCDATGRIFGLMPHPEAFVRWTAHPEWTRCPEKADQNGEGLLFFERAFKEAQ